MPDPKLDTEAHRTHLYGRRKGKRLRTSLRNALTHDLPLVRINPDVFEQPFDPRTLFSEDITRVWFEIGFGGGEHLATQAQLNPDVGFIGAEIFENGIASLLKKRTEASLENIGILDSDAREFLPKLAENCLDRVFLLYPDPWPKAKHAKRRFINQFTLDHLARVMTPGAELRIATDHPEYTRWCLRQIPVHRAFQWDVSGPESWQHRPKDMVSTRYEKKAVREERAPVYLNFFRTSG